MNLFVVVFLCLFCLVGCLVFGGGGLQPVCSFTVSPCSFTGSLFFSHSPVHLVCLLVRFHSLYPFCSISVSLCVEAMGHEWLNHCCQF